MSSIEVRTTVGLVRGEQHDGIAAFKGIPYAEPPCGGNLFKPSVARASWGGSRDCTTYGPCCPQRAALDGVDLAK